MSGRPSSRSRLLCPAEFSVLDFAKYLRLPSLCHVTLCMAKRRYIVKNVVCCTVLFVTAMWCLPLRRRGCRTPSVSILPPYRRSSIAYPSSQYIAYPSIHCIPFFPYIPHLHLFIFSLPVSQMRLQGGGFFPIYTFYLAYSSASQFQFTGNLFEIMCACIFALLVRNSNGLLYVAIVLVVLNDSSPFVMLHPTYSLCPTFETRSQ